MKLNFRKIFDKNDIKVLDLLRPALKSYECNVLKIV